MTASCRARSRETQWPLSSPRPRFLARQSGPVSPLPPLLQATGTAVPGGCRCFGTPWPPSLGRLPVEMPPPPLPLLAHVRFATRPLVAARLRHAAGGSAWPCQRFRALGSRRCAAWWVLTVPSRVPGAARVIPWSAVTPSGVHNLPPHYPPQPILLHDHDEYVPVASFFEAVRVYEAMLPVLLCDDAPAAGGARVQ